MPQTTNGSARKGFDYYADPYENWMFGAGYPYSLLIRRGVTSHFFTAVSERRFDRTANGVGLKTNGESESNTVISPIEPPLWKNTTEPLSFTPFMFRLPESDSQPNVNSASALTAGLTSALFELESGIGTTSTTNGPANDAGFRIRTNFPVPEYAVHPTLRQPDAVPIKLDGPDWEAPSSITANSKLVIIGVIDDGIPFANRSFLDSTGSTKIEYLWSQSGQPQNTKNATPVPFGRELSRPEIDELINAHADEDVLYRRAGIVSHGRSELNAGLANRASHGSIVLDIAAGNRGGKEQTTDDIRIIAVQLPKLYDLDTSGFGKDMFVLSALHYIFERAERIARQHLPRDKKTKSGLKPELPMVVNFSYGFTGGPHDGSGHLEAALGELIDARRKIAPTALVMPAGNNFRDNMHGSIVEQHFVGGHVSVHWRIQPNDRTPNYLEIWFPQDCEAGQYDVEISPPTAGSAAGKQQHGTTTIEVSADPEISGPDQRNFETIVDRRRRTIGQISADLHRDSRWRVMIALAPSEPEGRGEARSPAGNWEITVRRKPSAAPLSEPIEFWIQRDTRPDGPLTGNRQSYFDNPKTDINTKPFVVDDPEGFVRRFGTLNGTATHSSITLVASVSDLTSKPTDYSSAGSISPEKLGQKSSKSNFSASGRQVDCSAPSEALTFVPGLVGSGVRSGSSSRLIGTSAAAPLVVRDLARKFWEISRNEPNKIYPKTIKRAEAENYVPLPPLDVPMLSENNLKRAGTGRPNDAPKRTRTGRTTLRLPKRKGRRSGKAVMV